MPTACLYNFYDAAPLTELKKAESGNALVLFTYNFGEVKFQQMAESCQVEKVSSKRFLNHFTAMLADMSFHV
jgi:hypothetical protein